MQSLRVSEGVILSRSARSGGFHQADPAGGESEQEEELWKGAGSPELPSEEEQGWDQC